MTFFLVHICLIFLPKTKRRVKTLLEWADPLLSKKWSRLGDTPKKTVMTTSAPVVLLGAINFFSSKILSKKATINVFNRQHLWGFVS